MISRWKGSSRTRTSGTPFHLGRALAGGLPIAPAVVLLEGEVVDEQVVGADGLLDEMAALPQGHPGEVQQRQVDLPAADEVRPAAGPPRRSPRRSGPGSRRTPGCSRSGGPPGTGGPHGSAGRSPSADPPWSDGCRDPPGGPGCRTPAPAAPGWPPGSGPAPAPSGRGSSGPDGSGCRTGAPAGQSPDGPGGCSRARGSRWRSRRRGGRAARRTRRGAGPGAGRPRR